MTEAILAFIRAHWIGVLVGVGIFGVFATIEVQRIEIGHLHRLLKDAQAEEAICKNSVTELERDIDNQNDALEKVSAKSNARIKAAAAALARAKNDAAGYAATAIKLATRPVTPDDCQDMKDSVDTYIRGAR